MSDRNPNLRRGGIKGSAETAERARRAKAAHRAAEGELGALAVANPYSAYESIHESMTRSIVRLLRMEDRDRSKPSREVTDRLREYRQLTEALAAYHGSRGTSAEMSEFFESLNRRIQALLAEQRCPDCGIPVQLEAHPIATMESM